MIHKAIVQPFTHQTITNYKYYYGFLWNKHELQISETTSFDWGNHGEVCLLLLAWETTFLIEFLMWIRLVSKHRNTIRGNRLLYLGCPLIVYSIWILNLIYDGSDHEFVKTYVFGTELGLKVKKKDLTHKLWPTEFDFQISYIKCGLIFSRIFFFSIIFIIKSKIL